MKKVSIVLCAAALAAASLTALQSADATGRKRPEHVRTWLDGYSEIPSLSVPGRGFFRAIVDEDAGTIQYWLTYDGIPEVTQAHFHFGQRHSNAPIVVFLCTNLGNSPGAQACPQSPGQVSGTITAANVGAGAAAQGLAANEFNELVDAIRNHAIYVNVHSASFPAGHIRGQL
jgi:hypothetical protein